MLEHKDLTHILKSKGYTCPICDEYPNDDDDGYEANGIKYPQFYNEYKGGTMDGSIDDWDEVHCCGKCNTEFWFTNGAY